MSNIEKLEKKLKDSKNIEKMLKNEEFWAIQADGEDILFIFWGGRIRINTGDLLVESKIKEISFIYDNGIYDAIKDYDNFIDYLQKSVLAEDANEYRRLLDAFEEAFDTFMDNKLEEIKESL